ncbi:glycosyl hydrolase family 43 [Sphingomonas xinjiangensis]|uniref:Glycosyl hydrolase family 43 n=1 Tax=Sphingomonas xinjiangensis TaxID=643568 RepID=A0A840YQY0_9SPHN|nr:glycosyl hydrolase family 43 [Sphingomonas xinjiangensis]MBB5710993.1 hypothetical protein [Sphingomonas xinjiangensis]
MSRLFQRLRSARALVPAAIIAASLTATPGSAQQTLQPGPPPGAPETPFVDPDRAYLFAHMTKARYGVLHYSVSLDGLHWKRLNSGAPVSRVYHGHASIAQGVDGRYFLVGNNSDDDRLIRFWVSTDLIRWTPYATYQPDLAHIPGLTNAQQRIGAPKLFFDKASRQFLLTWHTPTVPGSKEDPESYWTSQRTVYVVSEDLRRFASAPRRLFDWNMATIDTVIQPREDGEGYCAIVKDERYPSYAWTTGKTIRISCAASLLGPYPLPGPPLSPNFREAPTIIRAPNNREWLLYYEQYAGTSYGLSKGRSLEGPWYQVSGNTGQPDWDRYAMPTDVRHGSMIQISRRQYDAVLKAFPMTD